LTTTETNPGPQATPLFENARAFFEHVVNKSLAGQYPAGQPGITWSGETLATCYYRTEDGRRCVAGELIPDGRYCSDMECENSDSLFCNFPSLEDCIPPGMDKTDVYHAQRAHDNTATDSIVDGQFGPWKHDLFVARLREWVPAFKGF